jgi:hypothetical protein
MIHELRIYRLHPGKKAAFLERFRELALRFFDKHDIRFLGFWEVAEPPPDSQAEVSAGGVFRPAAGATFDQDKIAYLVAFEDIAARDDAWRGFVADEDWRRLRTEGEQRTGPLVAEESFLLLRPTDFSPLGSEG